MKKIELYSYLSLEDGMEDYLKSVDGIIDVKENVVWAEPSEIVIHYDESKIGLKAIAAEYIIFNKYFLVSSFDKFLNKKLKEKVLTIKDVCCEYCLASYMEYLYFNDNIGYAYSITKMNDSFFNYKIKVGYFDVDIDKVEEELNKM